MAGPLRASVINHHHLPSRRYRAVIEDIETSHASRTLPTRPRNWLTVPKTLTLSAQKLLLFVLRWNHTPSITDILRWATH